MELNNNTSSGDNQVSDKNNVSGDNTNVLKLATIKIKKAYYTADVFVKILKETDEFVIIDNYKDTELQQMGISEELIKDRTTLKMFDEALINM